MNIPHHRSSKYLVCHFPKLKCLLVDFLLSSVPHLGTPTLLTINYLAEGNYYYCSQFTLVLYTRNLPIQRILSHDGGRTFPLAVQIWLTSSHFHSMQGWDVHITHYCALHTPIKAIVVDRVVQPVSLVAIVKYWVDKSNPPHSAGINLIWLQNIIWLAENVPLILWVLRNSLYLYLYK